jgi:carboxyl-terminal processing protease
MRSALAMSWCLAATTLLAAPVPNLPPEPAKKPVQPARPDDVPGLPPIGGGEEAQANQLIATVNQIAEQYVRRVLPQHLMLSALSGLYEAARTPVPSNLREQVLGVENDQQLLGVVRKALADVEKAEALQGRTPLRVAVQAMLRTLDPHSSLVHAVEQRRNAVQGSDTFGVGLEVDEATGGPLTVRLVYPGGPAQMAGLRPGDQLLRLGGKPAGELSADEVARLLHQTAVGEGVPSIPPPPPLPGTPADPPIETLRVVYRRKGSAKEMTLDLPRERFRAETVVGVSRRDNNTWNCWLDPEAKIAHVRILTLARNTGQELFDMVSRYQDQGLRGLVLDLRWCPGGYLNEAVECARLFAGDGLIATIQSRTGEDRVFRSQGDAAFPNLPLVVLINGDTSGGAELIAAALQDHKRAVICGQRSRGKGSVQTPIDLNVPGLGVKLTTGTFLRPSGQSLHRFPDSKMSDPWGIRPDPGCEFRLSTDLSRALGEWWQLQTLRPYRSVDRLPLDDPTTDCQLQAAAEKVRELLRGKTAAATRP